MRIPCPYCGLRDLSEFRVRGTLQPDRPDPQAIEPFADWLHLRDNPAGDQDELWYHAQGCRQWLVVRRNSVTHAVLGVTPARAAIQARRAGA